MTRGGSQSSLYDQVFEEIEAGRVFTIGAALAVGAGAAPHIQLLNPGASDRKIYVLNAYAAAVTGNVLELRQYDTPLTTLVGTGFNYFLDNPNGNGELRTQGIAPALGTTIFPVRTGVMFEIPIFYKWGFLIPQGSGVLIAHTVNSTTIAARFDWVEMDV